MNKLNDLTIIFCLAFLSPSFAQVSEKNISSPAPPTIEPYRSDFTTFRNAEEALTFDSKKSTLRKSLNGTWKFKWVADSSTPIPDFFLPTTSTETWDDLPVPSNWQIFTVTEKRPYDRPVPHSEAGVSSSRQKAEGKKTNSTGLYRTTFTIPEAWNDKTILLHFEGVQPACRVWINGKLIGSHEGSMTSFEFHVTEQLVPGINELAVEIPGPPAFANFERQQHWQLSGIFGEVLLLAAPEVQVSDLTIRALLNEHNQGDLKLEAYLKNFSKASKYGYSVDARLFDKNNQLLISAANQTLEILETQQELPVRMAMEIPNPKPWNAETPNLYHLVIEVKNPNKEVIAAITQKVGFRNVSVTGGKLLVNGEAITIKGINHSEFDPARGYVSSRKAMVRNIILMKQHHINAVRTAPFSSHKDWYDLCDEYGLYVFDSANMGSERSEITKIPGENEPDRKSAYLIRAKSMVARNKNHPSVITWSIGDNTALNPNFQSMAEYIRLADPSRPIHFAGASALPINAQSTFDLLSLPFISFKEGNKAPGQNQKPTIFTSLANMSGNAGGNLKDLWSTISANPKTQGAFLGNWSDQGIQVPKAGGNEKNTPESFLVSGEGMINPDQLPQPELHELKKVIQSIAFGPLTIEPGQGGKLSLTNQYDFTALTSHELIWELQENGKIIQSGKIDKLNAPQRRTEQIFIPFKIPDLAAGVYSLNLSVRLKETSPWAPAGFEVAWFQYLLPTENLPTSNITFSGIPQLRQTVLPGSGLTLKGQNFSVIFDRNSGTLSSFQYKGKELLSRGLYPDFWRAPTTLDRSGGAQSQAWLWQKAGLDSLELVGTDLRSEKLTPHIYKITLVHNLKGNKGMMLIQSVYTVYATGDIHLKHTITPSGEWPSLPKVGFQGHLIPELSRIAWYGNGPHETYPDRKESGRIGSYEGKVADQHFPFIKPQENGNKTDVKWVAITDESGTGLLAISDSVFNVNVQNYATNSPTAAGITTDSLQRGNVTVLNLDLVLAGLSGDQRTAVPAVSYEYSYRLKAIDSTIAIRDVLASNMHILGPLTLTGDTVNNELRGETARPAIRKHAYKRKTPAKRRRRR